jgi:hypothetical protein
MATRILVNRGLAKYWVKEREKKIWLKEDHINTKKVLKALVKSLTLILNKANSTWKMTSILSLRVITLAKEDISHQ